MSALHDAAPRDLLVMVLKQGGALVAGGLLAGLVAARAAARVFATTLYDVAPGDPMTFVAVAGALAAIGVGRVLRAGAPGQHRGSGGRTSLSVAALSASRFPRRS